MLNKKFSSLVAFFAVASAIFSSAETTQAANHDLIISEILVGGKSSDEEFVELYNPTPADIDLKSLPLKLHTINSTGTSDTSKTLTYTGSSTVIKSHAYFLLATASYASAHNDVSVGITYSAGLVSNGAVYISISATKDLNVIDLVCWGNSAKCAFSLPDPQQNHSLERIANGSDWQKSCLEGGSPGEEATVCEPKPMPTAPGNSNEGNSPQEADPADDSIANKNEDLYLNEIFPNPEDGADSEYIEIASGASAPVDLFGWRIKDASKGKGYQFKEHIVINPEEYFAIYHPDSKIALNNSNETVYLYDPQGEPVSSVNFEKSQKGASYSSDGKAWKWTKYPTPGVKNKFDSAPTVKIKKPKNIYKNILAEFSVTAKDKETKKLKYSWDFGDGRKSYQPKTSHKYLDTGKYTAILSVSDASQTVEKKFTVNVKNSPHPDLEIVKIVPNPTGADMDRETVDLKNNSQENINLEGWKIATGNGDRMYNHPMGDGMTLGAGETKTITREMSKFTLNNKIGKVSLVSPDGINIDEMAYEKEKIDEDETYAKIDGEWLWLASDAKENDANNEEDTGKEEVGKEIVEQDASGEVLRATDENDASYAPLQIGYTPEDEFIFFKFFGLLEFKPQENNFCPLYNPASSIALGF